MLDLNTLVLFGILAAVIGSADYVLYWTSILRGRTRPSRVSWFILSVLGFLIASSYFGVGATITLPAAIVEAVGPLIVFLLALKYGEGTAAEPEEKIALIGAAIGVMLWILTSSALVALLAFLLIDAMGMWMTGRKTYKDHTSEDWQPWSLSVLGNIFNVLALNLFAISTWQFEIAVYPIYLLCVNLIILALIFRPKIRKLIGRGRAF